jgi:hypothetical protein
MPVVIAVFYSMLWVIAAWRLADWRHWRDYYPTMLFAAVGDLFYELIAKDYPMWAMEPNGLPSSIIPMALLAFIGMPLSVFVYLSRFPENRTPIIRLLYILLFTAIFVALEHFSVVFGAITYHHGWHLGWSLLFDIVMFFILYVHHKSPVKAMLLSAVFITALSLLFDLDFDKLE